MEIDGWTIDGGKAGPAFRGDAGQVKSIVETFGADVAFRLKSHSRWAYLTVEAEHVKRVQKTVKETGEWFILTLLSQHLESIVFFGMCWITPMSKPRRVENPIESAIVDSIAPIDVAILPLLRKMEWTKLQIYSSTLLPNIRYRILYDGVDQLGSVTHVLMR